MIWRRVVWLNCIVLHTTENACARIGSSMNTAEAQSHLNNRNREDDFLMNRSLKAHLYTGRLFSRIVLTWLSAAHGTQSSLLFQLFPPRIGIIDFPVFYDFHLPLWASFLHPWFWPDSYVLRDPLSAVIRLEWYILLEHKDIFSEKLILT